MTIQKNQTRKKKIIKKNRTINKKKETNYQGGANYLITDSGSNTNITITLGIKRDRINSILSDANTGAEQTNIVDKLNLLAKIKKELEPSGSKQKDKINKIIEITKRLYESKSPTLLQKYLVKLKEKIADKGYVSRSDGFFSLFHEIRYNRSTKHIKEIGNEFAMILNKTEQMKRNYSLSGNWYDDYNWIIQKIRQSLIKLLESLILCPGSLLPRFKDKIQGYFVKNIKKPISIINNFLSFSPDKFLYSIPRHCITPSNSSQYEFNLIDQGAESQKYQYKRFKRYMHITDTYCNEIAKSILNSYIYIDQNGEEFKKRYDPGQGGKTLIDHLVEMAKKNTNPKFSFYNDSQKIIEKLAGYFREKYIDPKREFNINSRFNININTKLDKENFEKFKVFLKEIADFMEQEFDIYLYFFWWNPQICCHEGILRSKNHNTDKYLYTQNNKKDKIKRVGFKFFDHNAFMDHIFDKNKYLFPKQIQTADPSFMMGVTANQRKSYIDARFNEIIKNFQSAWEYCNIVIKQLNKQEDEIKAKIGQENKDSYIDFTKEELKVSIPSTEGLKYNRMGIENIINMNIVKKMLD